MKSARQLLFLVSVLYLPLQAGAWGAVGHRLVAKIAYSQLSKAAKDSVDFYLGYNNFVPAATWMDEIKNNSNNDSLKPFHYVNFDKGTEFSLDSTNNIIGELNKVIYELKHRNNFSKDHVAMDLKILIHLIGDLHQPLHVGYAGDKGGNDVEVFIDAGPSNLHRVWDSDIIEKHIAFEPTDWANTANYSKEKLDSVKHVDIVEWMNESRSYVAGAYDFEGHEIKHKYIKQMEPIIEQRLLFGGLRLAKLIRVIFNA